MKGKVYLIPTPLGPFETIEKVQPNYNNSIIHTIDVFIVEQTRTARRYLSSIKHPIPIDDIQFLELNKHTDQNEVHSYLDSVMQGRNIGVLSEAGTPCIADPGSVLVKLAHLKDIRVIPLVGPNSILLALMASGLNGQNFLFHGYLPIERNILAKCLKEIESNSQKNGQTQIFIETPYRNSQILKSIISVCSMDTNLCIATDLTLSNESIKTKTVGEWKKRPPDIHKRPTVFLLSRD